MQTTNTTRSELIRLNLRAL